MASLISAHTFPFLHKPSTNFLQTHKPSPPFSIVSVNAQTKSTPQAPHVTSQSPPPQPNLDIKKDENDNSSLDCPPLVCFFGAAQREFLPMVRVSERQMHPDIISTWKMMHYDPPEFARAPSGPSSNVAVAFARQGGSAAFMGKVGLDEFGLDLVHELNWEKVQTRGVEISLGGKTGASYMKLGFRDRKDGKRGKELFAETVKESAEDSLLESEINIDVLKEAKILHFNSEALLTPSMQKTLFKAIDLTKQFGGVTFFDPNLPLPLWESRDKTLKLIKPAWNQSEMIEVSRYELEFLLNEPHFIRKRTVPPLYCAETAELTKYYNRDYYHYTREDLAPLWHEGIKLLIVTHATLRVHYYTQEFDGSVIGAEDVLLSPLTCDRSGSGDAMVGAILRKLTALPEILENQDLLEKQLRFAISAGIVTQWTTGSIRGLPSESATQNMKETLFIPSYW